MPASLSSGAGAELLLIPIDSKQKAFLAASAALAKSAESVVILDLRKLSTVTDFFIVCTAETAPQMTAIKDHIEENFSQRGFSVWYAEGSTSQNGEGAFSSHDPRWVLLDCGDVVVHLLDSPGRALYRLEELWADAPRVSLPVELTSIARKTRAA